MSVYVLTYLQVSDVSYGTQHQLKTHLFQHWLQVGFVSPSGADVTV